MVIGPAQAAVTDNLVPTANYIRQCVDDTATGDGALCQTDNRDLWVWFQSSVNDRVRTTVHSSLDGSYDGTDLVIHYEDDPVYSGSGETDVIYQVSTSGFSGSTIGLTWCNDDATNSDDCDQQYVRFKSSSVVDRELACHETGHAVGLLHGSGASPTEANSNGEILGCMETPDTGSRPYLQSNNVDNINDTY